jgi:thiamine kinase-like enzyme
MSAAYLGSLVDTEQHRYWLLIEKVSGEELYKVGDLSIWCQVASWLAKMHNALEELQEGQLLRSVLLHYDEEFYSIWIDRAELFLLESNSDRELDGERVRWLADQYRRLIPVLCSLPPTLIHGEFYASNVLVDCALSDVRICPIDWETAALGPALMDLAALVGGDWTDAERDMLTKSYFESLEEPEAVLGGHEFDHALRCCRLHFAVRWLGWAEDWNPPASHRRDWLAEAVQLAEEIVHVPSLT